MSGLPVSAILAAGLPTGAVLVRRRTYPEVEESEADLDRFEK